MIAVDSCISGVFSGEVDMYRFVFGKGKIEFHVGCICGLVNNTIMDSIVHQIADRSADR